MDPGKINFSKEVKELIALARLEAIDLGYNYISGNHLLLADCLLNIPPSIKEFVFANDIAFKEYYKRHRIQEASVFNELDRKSLPLTKGAEAMIKTAVEEARFYGSKYVERHYLFLASCRNKDNLFTDSKDKDLNIYPRMLAYYKDRGLILEVKKQVTLIDRVKNIFR